MPNELIEKKAFLGRGWAFPIRFNKGYNSALMSQFEEDIQQSLIILLSTIRGERFLQPTYGTTVQELLFEALDITIANQIGEEIKRAILIHEPRVLVDRVDVTQETLNGFLEISIDYTIVATNTRYNFVYPFYLVEGTDLPQATPQIP